MPDDITALVELGKRGCALTQYAEYGLDEHRAKMNVLKFMLSERALVLVCEDDGKITGLLMAVLTLHPVFACIIASDLVFYAETPGSGREMCRQFEQWATDNGAHQIEMGVSSGLGNRADPFFERRGFNKVGGIFVKKR